MGLNLADDLNIPGPSDIIALIPDIDPQVIDLDFGDIGTIPIGDMGSFTIEKIVFDNGMDWNLEFRNALPFPVDLVSFDIYVGDWTEGEIPPGTEKFCSLTMENIDPYTTRIESMVFESNPPELEFNSSLTIDINIDVNENPSTLNNCDLDLCVADAITLDGSFDPNNVSSCSSACDPCLEIFVCPTRKPLNLVL